MLRIATYSSFDSVFWDSSMQPIHACLFGHTDTISASVGFIVFVFSNVNVPSRGYLPTCKKITNINKTEKVPTQKHFKFIVYGILQPRVDRSS